MKNLTKVLAVVLALCLGLSMVGTAAFTDVAEDASYSEAVSILNALGILTGYEDGSFGPEKTITRAEFSAVVCRALGLGEALGGTTMFSDVASDYWAAGYIALVQQQGIVNGYPDGTFLPDNPVKYEEAIKMLVVALGYDPTIAKVDAAGNAIDYYPGAYIVVASQKGVTANLSNAKVGEEASRATVAQMVYNALTVPMMIQTGFGTNTTYGTGDQLLLNKLNVTKFEGSVSQTSASDDSVKENEFILRVDAQITADIGNTSASSYVRAYPTKDSYDANPYIDEFVFNGDYAYLQRIAYDAGLDETVKGLLDYAVVAYVLDADTDEPKLLAIAKRGTRNKEVSFMSEDINDTKTQSSTGLDKGKVYVYTDKDAEKYETYDVAIEKVYINGREDLYDVDGGTLADIATAIEYYFDSEVSADIRLLCNTTSDEYNVAYITAYKDYVVDSVNAKTYTVYGDEGKLILDEEDSDARFTIYKDGEIVSFADIAENDVLSVAGYINSNKELEYGTVIITSTQVSGKIETFDDEDKKVTVDGKEYLYDGDKFSVGAGSGYDVRIGDQATFYVNARGVLVGVDTENTKTNLSYGFATVFGKSSGIGSTWKLVICDTEGKWQTLDLNTKVDFNDKGSVSVSDYTTNEAMGGYIGIDNEVDGNLLINNVVAYETNSSGKINKLYITATTNEDDMFYFNETTSTYNSSVNTLGSFDLNDNVVIYSVDSDFDLATTEVKSDDLYIGSMGSLVDRETYTVTGYNSDKNGVPAVMFGRDVIGAVDFASDFFVVSSKTTKENADGDLGVEFTGFVAGEETTVFVADDADVFKMDYTKVTDKDEVVKPANEEYIKTAANGDISKGDVLVMSKTSSGEANKVYILASASDLYDDDNAFKYNAYGSTAKLITFEQGDTTYSYYLAYAMERDGTRLSIADSMDLEVGTAPTADETRLSISGAKGATFDINSGSSGKVTSSAYGDINYDKTDDLTGDLVFAKISGTNKVEEFVNFVQYND